MTVEEKLKRGMFEHQCDAVMEKVKADKANESMKGRWAEPTEAYPTSLYHILWIVVKNSAREYVEENCP